MAESVLDLLIDRVPVGCLWGQSGRVKYWAKYGKTNYSIKYTREVGHMIYLISELEKNGQLEEASAKLSYLNSHWYCVGNEKRFDEFRDDFYVVKMVKNVATHD